MEILKFEKNNLERICNFVKSEYETAQNSDGFEHIIIKNIIESEKYLPNLTFEAWDNGFLIGFMFMYMETVVLSDGTKSEVLMFGPAAVKESHRSRGVGSAMMRYCLRQAQWMGYEYAVVSGQSSLYSKFGFVPDTIIDSHKMNLMRLDLNPDVHRAQKYVGA